MLGPDAAVGFRKLALQWHPDHCKDPRANQVLAHLKALRDLAVHKVPLAPLERFTIPGGSMSWVDNRTVRIESTSPVHPGVATAVRAAAAHPGLTKRIPALTAESDARCTTYTATTPLDIVPMGKVQAHFKGKVPAGHAAWIGSRLLELVMEASMLARTLCGGIVPESLLVAPKEHGVFLADWRFAVPLGQRMVQAPTALVPLVPPDKKASAVFDLRAVQQAALVLLGDPTGTGTALLLDAQRSKDGSIPAPFLTWLRTPIAADAAPKAIYTDYRDMLKRAFDPSRFLPLVL